MKTQLNAILVALSALLSANAHAQTSILDTEKIIKALPKQCEEPSSVLAEVRLRKWAKRSKEISQPITDEQRAAVFAVMRDQCVAVQMVLILRTLRSSIPMVEWSKINGDGQIEELLARIERTL
jgi:hypothetical protein